MSTIHVIETTNYDATRVYCFHTDRLASVVSFWHYLSDTDTIKEWKLDTGRECDRCQFA